MPCRSLTGTPSVHDAFSIWALCLVGTMHLDRCFSSVTLGPSQALGGERGERFERVIAFNANFHFNHTICDNG